MKRLGVILALLLVLLLVLPAGVAVAAQGLDRIIKAGEVVDEDLTVFGGSLVVEKGARVEGEVSIFGGSANLAGLIDGDVSVFGGSARLSGTVDGDVVVLGGELEVADAAAVNGECVLVSGSMHGDGADGLNCTAVGDLPDLAIPAIVPRLPNLPTEPITRVTTRSPFGTISAVTGRSLVLGLLALLIASIVPAQLDQVGDTIRRKPAASGVVGLLTAVAGPSLVLLLLIISVILTFVCIGILGYPIVLALVVALVAGLLLGWVAAGTLLGVRLARAFNLSNRQLPVTAALGTVVLTLAAGLLGELPFYLGGWLWSLLAFVIACAGLGAVALTRFGTRTYPLLMSPGGAKVAGVLETLPAEDLPAGE